MKAPPAAPWTASAHAPAERGSSLLELEGVEAALDQCAHSVSQTLAHELLLLQTLRIVEDELSRSLENYLATHRLNRNDFLALLQLLGHAGEDVSSSQLGSALALRPTHMTRIVDALVARKLIRRTRSRRDRRQVALRLADAGETLIRAVLAALTERSDPAWGVAPEGQAHALQLQLRRLLVDTSTARS